MSTALKQEQAATPFKYHGKLFERGAVLEQLRRLQQLVESPLPSSHNSQSPDTVSSQTQCQSLSPVPSKHSHTKVHSPQSTQSTLNPIHRIKVVSRCSVCGHRFLTKAAADRHFEFCKRPDRPKSQEEPKVNVTVEASPPRSLSPASKPAIPNTSNAGKQCLMEGSSSECRDPIEETRYKVKKCAPILKVEKSNRIWSYVIVFGITFALSTLIACKLI